MLRTSRGWWSSIHISDRNTSVGDIRPIRVLDEGPACDLFEVVKIPGPPEFTMDLRSMKRFKWVTSNLRPPNCFSISPRSFFASEQNISSDNKCSSACCLTSLTCRSSTPQRLSIFSPKRTSMRWSSVKRASMRWNSSNIKRMLESVASSGRGAAGVVVRECLHRSTTSSDTRLLGVAREFGIGMKNKGRTAIMLEQRND
jgi:hypothetical protein